MRKHTYLSLLTRLEGEVLQDSDQSDFHIQERKPHANAVPGATPKGLVCVGIDSVLVLLAEPGPTGVDEDEDKLTNHKTPQQFLVWYLLDTHKQ